MKDVFLTALTKVVNETKGLSLNITLNAHGTTISGSLIGYETYLKELSNSFKKANSDPTIAEVFSDKFTKLADVTATSSLSNKSESKNHDPNFIHLKGVRIVNSNGDFITNTLWRGKIDSIDGFFFGAF